MADFLSTGGILAFLGYNAYLILMGMYFWKRIRIYALNPFSWCMLAVFLAFVLNGLLDETFSSTSFGRLYYLAFGITLLLKDGIRCTRRRKECEFVVKNRYSSFWRNCNGFCHAWITYL